MTANTTCKIVSLDGYMKDTKVKLNLSGKKVSSIDVMRDRSDGQKFRTSFVVGDEACWDSWNLVYTGTITSITEKSVTIKPKYGDRSKRLSLDRFAIRNYDFSSERIVAKNAETMMYI